jgi:hypothetical protein
MLAWLEGYEKSNLNLRRGGWVESAVAIFGQGFRAEGHLSPSVQFPKLGLGIKPSGQAAQSF